MVYARDERPWASATPPAAWYRLIEATKLNGVDPEAWLADTRARIADHKITDLGTSMPWRFAP